MNSNQQIIFLDYDGVVTSARAFGWYNQDIYVVNFLRWVCEKASAQIVISSTWRRGFPESFFKAVWGEHLHKDWTTPTNIGRGFEHPERGVEVKHWLDSHPEVTKYLILDDDSDFLEEQKPFFIKTDSMNGMLFEDMMQIRDFFEIKTFPREQTVLFQCPEMFALWHQDEHDRTQKESRHKQPNFVN